eukprot:gene8565-33997_t
MVANMWHLNLLLRLLLPKPLNSFWSPDGKHDTNLGHTVIALSWRPTQGTTASLSLVDCSSHAAALILPPRAVQAHKRSLLTLGETLMAVKGGSKSPTINDSQLTRLLANSLAHCTMLACLNGEAQEEGIHETGLTDDEATFQLLRQISGFSAREEPLLSIVGNNGRSPSHAPRTTNSLSGRNIVNNSDSYPISPAHSPRTTNSLSGALIRQDSIPINPRPSPSTPQQQQRTLQQQGRTTPTQRNTPVTTEASRTAPGDSGKGVGMGPVPPISGGKVSPVPPVQLTHCTPSAAIGPVAGGRLGSTSGRNARTSQPPSSGRRAKSPAAPAPPVPVKCSSPVINRTNQRHGTHSGASNQPKACPPHPSKANSRPSGSNCRAALTKTTPPGSAAKLAPPRATPSPHSHAPAARQPGRSTDQRRSTDLKAKPPGVAPSVEPAGANSYGTTTSRSMSPEMMRTSKYTQRSTHPGEVTAYNPMRRSAHSHGGMVRTAFETIPHTTNPQRAVSVMSGLYRKQADMQKQYSRLLTEFQFFLTSFDVNRERRQSLGNGAPRLIPSSGGRRTTALVNGAGATLGSGTGTAQTPPRDRLVRDAPAGLAHIVGVAMGFATGTGTAQTPHRDHLGKAAQAVPCPLRRRESAPQAIAWPGSELKAELPTLLECAPPPPASNALLPATPKAAQQTRATPPLPRSAHPLPRTQHATETPPQPIPSNQSLPTPPTPGAHTKRSASPSSIPPPASSQEPPAGTPTQAQIMSPAPKSLTPKLTPPSQAPPVPKALLHRQAPVQQAPLIPKGLLHRQTTPQQAAAQRTPPQQGTTEAEAATQAKAPLAPKGLLHRQATPQQASPEVKAPGQKSAGVSHIPDAPGVITSGLFTGSMTLQEQLRRMGTQAAKRKVKRPQKAAASPGARPGLVGSPPVASQ